MILFVFVSSFKKLSKCAQEFGEVPSAEPNMSFIL